MKHAQILDPWARTFRTVLTLVIAFPSFAPVALLLLAALHAPDGSNVAIWAAALATWVTTASGVITRIMAIPAVNAWLARFRLAGQSISYAANDSPTQAYSLAAFANASRH